MNWVAHMLITYVVISLIVPNAEHFIIPIFIFSIIVDIDHIPGFIRLARMGSARKSLSPEEYSRILRTPLQEPLGIIMVLAVIFVLYLYGLDATLFIIAFIGILLHWIIDFLTIHTMPLYPFSDNMHAFFFRTKQQRLYSEIIITLASLVAFIFVYP
jgi:membrane-bound metal-dependent hydrolase YbcI (DUF457 family)